MNYNNIHSEDLELEDIVRILDIVESATYRLIPRDDDTLRSDYKEFNALHEAVNTAWRIAMVRLRREQESLDSTVLVD